ncbi:MAG: hypothetical protein LBT66_04585, partial [Methanobrevibacter sp.]|nr:hypothetical protein [Candidatus Methanovirga meridionalis]
MKMNNKILAMILIAVLAIGSVSFATNKDESEFGSINPLAINPLAINDTIGNFSFATNKVESEFGFINPLTINDTVGGVVPNEDHQYFFDLNLGMYKSINGSINGTETGVRLVKEILNADGGQCVNIYKAHIKNTELFLDETLNSNSNLELDGISTFYIIEGRQKGRINTTYWGADYNNNLESVLYSVKINVIKNNVDSDIILPVNKLNPNAKTQSIPVKISANYQKGLDTKPIVDDLKIYLEFKYLDNNIVKTFKSDTFSATSKNRPAEGGSVYNIATPNLLGDTDYNVSVKVAPESDNVYQISDPLKNYETHTKIRPKFEIISGAGNSNGWVGYDKNVGVNHIVSYRLINDKDNKPLVNKSVTFMNGKGTIKTNANGIINVGYTSFGDYNLGASFAGDEDTLSGSIPSQTLSIIPKIIPKLEIISGAGNSNDYRSPDASGAKTLEIGRLGDTSNKGWVTYDKNVGFNHVVSYRLVDAEDNNKPLVNKSITFMNGKGTLKTNENGIININYTSFGDYDLDASFAGGDDILPATITSQKLSIIPKITPKFEIISGTGNSNGRVGYAKDVGFNHVVSYKLTNADNNKPLVNELVTFKGGTQSYRTNTKGIIDVGYNSFGDYNLAASFAGDDYVTPTNIGQKTLSIKKIAGNGKQIITHVASWGSAFKASHWTSSNGFSFKDDNNWILAFIAETTLKFYDIDGKKIGSDNHFTQTSGSDIKYVNVPANAATMSITCGAQDSGDHTTKSGLEAGKGAINYDGTVAGKWSTKNCHVKTDTW